MRFSREPRSTLYRKYLSLLPLAIETTLDEATYAIRASGELDLSDCPKLEHALLDAEASEAAWILLDIDGLTFIDVAGIQTLVTAWRRSEKNGGRLQFTAGSGNVADMLRLTSLDNALPFQPGQSQSHLDAVSGTT